MDGQTQRETVTQDYKHRLSYHLGSCLILICNHRVSHNDRRLGFYLDHPWQIS